ncbi:AI-2E family transporter [Paenibacillus sp. IB182496]|uniref:AI-2E family transporter n=1 Tax=Paenibacillus sabuli TaxID=2772509 RepID=A0A927BRA7_9BACL|nr:AI-2E family transporter [Paenibacillus sabuli]MBD2844104.1 AI-2E family transporter [Paenibacillus sabuli]
MRTNRFFKLCFGIILVLLIFYLSAKANFIFRPLISLFNIVIVPLMLAGFFYYLLRPLVDLMQRRKMNRTLAILIIYVVIAGVLVGFAGGVWPPLRDQVVNLVEIAPNLFNSLSKQLQELDSNGFLASVLPEDTNLFSKVSEYLNSGFEYLTNYLSGLFTFVSNFAIVIFTFPIILFYMLKEGGKMGRTIVGFLPKRFRDEGTEAVGEIDHALSGFIVGRVIVNVALGVLMYIGFLLIGLPYALLLTVVAVIMNFVPFIGAILSAVPIVIVGFVESPSTALWALIIILAAQQIQDNLIAPYVFGKSLDIHPLTTILLILVGGDLAGILGILLIIPFYMAVKIVVTRVYRRFFKERWEAA